MIHAASLNSKQIPKAQKAKQNVSQKEIGKNKYDRFNVMAKKVNKKGVKTVRTRLQIDTGLEAAMRIMDEKEMPAKLAVRNPNKVPASAENTKATERKREKKEPERKSTDIGGSSSCNYKNHSFR